MKKQLTLKSAIVSTLAMVLLSATTAWADPCINAINAASQALDDAGGICKKKSAEFRRAATAANNTCKRVRDKYRACWSTFRTEEKRCKKLSRVITRQKCLTKARDVRRACNKSVRNSSARAVCSDKRRFATACFGKTLGGCAGPVLGAAGTCVAHWFGVFVKAAAGG